MKRTLMLAALFLAAVLSPATSQTKSDAQVAAKIEQLTNDYVQAYNRHDAAALAAFYTQDAVFLGAAGAPIVGKDAIEKFLAAALKRMGDPTETAKVIEAHALGDNAWSIGEFVIKVEGENGPAEVKGHWGAVYVPEGDGWKMRMISTAINMQPPAAPVSGSSSK